MKKILAVMIILACLITCAQAEYYTSSKDSYYHESERCTSGSIYPISEEGAWQFRKIACPICVNQQAIEGEILPLPVPKSFRLYSADMDAQEHILLAGHAENPGRKSSYIAMVSTTGNLIWEQENESDDLFFRDANLLPDGSIAALRQADGSESNNWQIAIAKDGKITAKLPVLQDVSCLEPAGNDILVVNRINTQKCQLLKYDSAGSAQWKTDPDGFYQMDLLTGEKMHLAYGSRAVDAEDYQGDHNAHAVLFREDGEIFCRIENDALNAYACAAWCPDGGFMLYGWNHRPGEIMKYNRNGEEIWRQDLEYLCGEDQQIIINGSPVRCLEIADILSLEDGLLLALRTDHNYARMILLDSEGYIQRDWIEACGDFAWVDSMQLLKNGEDLYLLTVGGTIDPMQAYESGMIYADIPLKYTCKKLG